MENEFLGLTQRFTKMEKKADEGYVDCFLGVVDILGFSDFVNQNANPMITIVQIIEHSFLVNESYRDKIDFKLLSDTIIVFTKEKTQLALLLLLFALENFSLKCLENGFMSRGSVVKGNFFLDKENDIMISPAFIEAYTLEEKEADYPRILIKGEVYDILIRGLKFDDIQFYIENEKHENLPFPKD